MMMRWIFALLLFLPSAAYAENTHAIAMHGHDVRRVGITPVDIVQAQAVGGDIVALAAGSCGHEHPH